MTFASARSRAGRLIGATLLTVGLSTFLLYDVGPTRSGAIALGTGTAIK